jgi:hypothetical protein
VANNALSNPLILDTDFVSFAALNGTQPPFTVKKIELVANATTVAGNVTVTDKNSSANLIPPTAVAVSLAVNAVVLNDNLPAKGVSWRDFAATGLTATKTTLYVWVEGSNS